MSPPELTSSFPQTQSSQSRCADETAVTESIRKPGEETPLQRDIAVHQGRDFTPTAAAALINKAQDPPLVPTLIPVKFLQNISQSNKPYRSSGTIQPRDPTLIWKDVIYSLFFTPERVRDDAFSLMATVKILV